ncbi:MAG: glycosyltransferase family 4 protein [Candidatus Obscuribacterales bacterium]|nr:glycosyltransferase family 4 protein [Candidatus Obscuribacterales bacterium]
MVVAVSRSGLNENVRWLLKGLYLEQLLQRFFGTIAVSEQSPAFLRALPLWKHRSCPLPAELIDCSFGPEGLKFLLERTHLSFSLTQENGLLSSFKIGCYLDREVSKKLKKLKSEGCKIFYGYEDASMLSFEQAHELGMKTVYELTIAHWELGSSLLKEEAARLPEWKETLSVPEIIPEKIAMKKKELELADLIICPSNFVASSLPQGRARKILAPFGSPLQPEATNEERRRKLDGPLRVLFVGSMTQRKGLADLFEAINLLKGIDVELTVVGAPRASLEFYTKQAKFKYLPPCSNREILALMKQSHVFCLPSIVEGRALVQQEAMSSELPLIITANTGGDDLISEGETGFIVPIRSPRAIAEKLAWCAENRVELIEMGISARSRAATYTWQAYAEKIATEIRTLL